MNEYISSIQNCKQRYLNRDSQSELGKFGVIASSISLFWEATVQCSSKKEKEIYIKKRYKNINLYTLRNH